MKAASQILLVVLIAAGCVHGTCDALEEAARADFVVSPKGNDAWPGIVDKPFASLSRARDAVRALKPDRDIFVLLRGGYYRIEETVVFGLEDAAAAGRTITYAAYPGEAPIIGSGLPVAGWEKVGFDVANVSDEARGRLWSAPTPPGIDTCTVLFDGETWLPRAQGHAFLPAKRWPRTEHAKHKRDLLFPAGAIPEDAAARGAEVRIVPNYPWVMNLLPLSQVDTDRNVAMTSVPATYGLGQLGPKHFPDGSCWLENLVEYIDEPGEWALDPSAKRIYLWPRGDRPSATIVAPRLSELIRVEGKTDYDGPADQPVRGLVFRGLTFTQADHWRWEPEKAGWALQHDWEMFDRPTAMLRFRGAEDCAVEECTFANSGAAAVRCDLHAQRIRIRRNHIHDVGGVGVLLAGYGPGTKDVNRDNEIVDNHIHNVGQVLWHAPGIFAWQSGHNHIAHNHIHHTAYTAIVVSGRIIWTRNGGAECANTIRWAEVDAATGNASREPGWGKGSSLASWRQRAPFMHGRENVVEYNDIHHCMQILGDGNGIYISGTGDANRVRFNYVHDVDSPTVNAAIRCDDDQHGTIMHGNIIANSCGEGFIIKGANTVTNNVVYNLRPTTPSGEEALHRRGYLVFPYGDCTGAVIERNIFCALEGDSPAVSEKPKQKRPPGLLRQTQADHNVYYHAGDPEWGTRHLTEQRQYGVEEHSIAADPKFVDAPNGNFELREDSPAKALGIVSLDLARAGVR